MDAGAVHDIRRNHIAPSFLRQKAVVQPARFGINFAIAMKALLQRSLGLAAGTLFFGTSLFGASSDWPQWRGPNRDGIAGADAPAVSALPNELKPVWKLAIGGGFSAPVVSNGKLVYADEHAGREIVHAVDAAGGKELWHIDYAPVYEDEWGAGPRATPIIEGDRVYVQSCNGEFRCLNLANGKAIWATSFEKDFGVKFLGSKANSGTASRRGNNGSGVIDGGRIFLPVGSTEGASIVCFDKMTGKVLWKAGDDEAAYSSFRVATLAGVRQVVAFTAEALLGLETQSGKILWRVPLKTGAKRHAMTPVIIGDTITVNSQTIGLVCIKISKEGQGLKASEAWVNKQLKINLATPVFIDGYFYSQGNAKNFVCVDSKTGQVKWSEPGFGKDYSSTLAVGKNLLVLSDEGQLFLIAADLQKYHEIARLQVCGKTWSFPAYANGRLYVRDGKQLLCIDLSPMKSASL